jgi:hypothetical protein
VIALLIAGLLIQAEGPDAAFGQRMRDSAAAAQSLQGPLDGHWTLRDAQGRALYEIQIADPPQGAAPIEGAWQAETTRAIGPVETLSLSGARLVIAFAPGPEQVRLRLTRAGADLWRGWMDSATGRAAVRLIRDRDAASTAP